MKERVTLTIDRDLLQKVDASVNNIDIKNRSHAIEMLLVKALGENRPLHAIILAGGKGGCLENLPCCMRRIHNKPLIQHNIDLLRKYGVTDITISLCKNSKIVREYFSDGIEYGVNITYLEEEEPLGTAGAIQKLKDKLQGTFIILNADELKDIDLDDMFDFHRKHKCAATMALTTVEDPSKYGVALMNGQKIMTFVEKPSKERAPSKLINAGLYIFEPEVIKMVPEGYSMLEQDILPKLASQEKLNGYIFSGQWFDTGTDSKIAEAEAHWQG